MRELTLPSSGFEGVAYALFRQVRCADPWSGDSTTRYLLREIIPVEASDIISSSPDHIHTATRSFARVLRQAALLDCVPAFVHGHPGGYNRFSRQDDADEPALIEMAQNRNGRNTRLLSVVFTGTRGIFGRVWENPRSSQLLSSILVIGDSFEVHAEGLGGDAHDAWHRQALAFGPALRNAIANLRIGIIGCGATGSAVAVLLTRLGARRLLLIDKDTVETTNLSRLHGATRTDVGKLKTHVLRDHLHALGLDAQVQTFNGWVGDVQTRDGLKACDLIFGCTDDHDGRLLLNRFAYFYLTPLIDLGIGIDTNPDSHCVTHAESRITVAIPSARCLLCRGVVDPVRAREDDLLRRDPDEYARRRAEGDAYIRGAGLPDPAVVTLTTGAACLALDELIHRLTGYRRSGAVNHRVVKHHLGEEKRPGTHDGPCSICMNTQYTGLGDVEPFLDRVG